MGFFFKGKVGWSDGTYLTPEHLYAENEYLENTISNTRFILNNYEDVKSIRIDEILLTRGILSVVEFEGMFSNFQFITYNMEAPTEILSNGDRNGKVYEIREDLSKFAKIIMEKGLLFYLSIDNQEYMVKEWVPNNSDGVILEKILPKLLLTPEHLINNARAAIPVLRIISDKGGFIVDDTYEAPMALINKDKKIYVLLEKFVKFLRNKAIEMASGFFTKINNNKFEDSFIEKMNYSLQYNSIMPEILVLESLLYSKQPPISVFLSLQRIIGSLSLLRFTNLPSLQIYNHYDIYGSINSLISIIIHMINSLKIDGERLQFQYKDTKFILTLPLEVFTPHIKTYLLLEMENEKQRDNLINWIEDARICGTDTESIINIKRVRGLERKIFNTPSFGNRIIVVEVFMQSEYLLPSNSVLLIYNDYNDYIPMNIVLYWRNSPL